MTADPLAILPLLIPAATAPAAMLALRRRRTLGLAVSVAGAVALVAAALLLLCRVQDGAVRPYLVGAWPAPFGIVLVLDRLSAIMLAVTAVLALLVLLHAVATGLDREGWHFHPLFHFLLLGLDGAFLTGDLFNLFVFFEVLLIASYGLMLHGQGANRLKAAIPYVVVNILGSSLFLLALAMLYSLTGTLNMADMARRAALVSAADGGLLRGAGLLLAAVFAIKAAVVPLHLWLPRTYVAAAPAVAALFAILTKVGVYAMIRVVPLVFGADAGVAAWVPAPWLLPAAVATAGVGFAGVLAARGLREQAAFAVVGSTGTLMLSLSSWTAASTAAALFYLVNAVFAGAALFLVADAVERRRGAFRDTLAASPRFADAGAAGAMFLAAAVAAVGLPPLAGFVGKLLILAAAPPAVRAAVWAAVLLTTFAGVLGFARAGSALFWSAAPPDAAHGAVPRPRSDLAAPAALTAVLFLLSVGAGWLSAQTLAAARQVHQPARYVAAVLGRP